MSTFKIVILTPTPSTGEGRATQPANQGLQLASAVELSDGRIAAWCANPPESITGEIYTTEAAARAVYPSLPALPRFAGQNDEPLAVPATVTRRQLFLWLNTQGHTRAAIRTLLEQTPDATAREAALIEFDEAQEFKRTHPLILQLAAALGYSATQLDAAWVAAAQL